MEQIHIKVYNVYFNMELLGGGLRGSHPLKSCEGEPSNCRQNFLRITPGEITS